MQLSSTCCGVMLEVKRTWRRAYKHPSLGTFENEEGASNNNAEATNK